jgi:diguanylate cyclase (GGDEF)-like protein
MIERDRRVAGKSSPGVRSVRTWRLWTLRPAACGFLLVAECAAFLITAVLVAAEPLSRSWAIAFGVLTVLTIGYTEAATRSTRMQRYLGSGTIGSNPMSVWSYAGVLVLPAGWASALIAAQYAHALLRWRKDHVGHPHRIVFTAAATMLAQLATATLVAFGVEHADSRGHVVSGLIALAGVGVFVVVNSVVLLTGVWLAVRPPAMRSLLPEHETLIFECATLCLGIVTAEFMTHSPVLVPTVLLLVAVLHRSAVVKSLQELARTDNKTGLLSMAAWTDTARAALSRAQSAGDVVTVLLIDLDRFKLINDRYGHLAGDRVLVAVGACLRAELRDHDAVGRFGGEEFVAVLHGPEPSAAAEIASRLRGAISELTVGDDQLRVTASIGLAHYDPRARPENTLPAVDELLNALLEQADIGLYEAKRSGRNQVRRAEPARRISDN